MIENIINLMVTEACNLKCKYCYQPESMRSNKDMTKQIAFDAISFLNKNFKDGFTVMLYGGEPLLRFDLIKDLLLTYPHIQFKMLTNGLKLTDEMGDFFYKHRDHINLVWSAEGLKSHDINVTFRDVQDKIKPMLNLIKKMKFGIHLVIADPSTMIEDFKFLYEEGFRSFKFSIPRKWEIETSVLQQYKDNMFILTNMIYDGTYEGASVMLWDKLSAEYKNKDNPLYHDFPYFCGTGQHTFTINTIGDIYPCDWFYALNKYKLCSIYDEKPILTSIFTEYGNKPELLNKVCKNCDIYHVCTRGMCLAENLELTGDLLKPSKYWCEISHVEVEIMSYLAKKQGVVSGTSKNNMC